MYTNKILVLPNRIVFLSKWTAINNSWILQRHTGQLNNHKINHLLNLQKQWLLHNRHRDTVNGIMVHSHCMGPGPGTEPGMMGLYIMLCTVHTTQGQGQGTGMGTGTNGLYTHFPIPGPVPGPLPIPCPVPSPVQCE